MNKGANFEALKQVAELYDLMTSERDKCYQLHPIPQDINLPNDIQTKIDEWRSQGLPDTVIWRSVLVKMRGSPYSE